MMNLHDEVSCAYLTASLMLSSPLLSGDSTFEYWKQGIAALSLQRAL